MTAFEQEPGVGSSEGPGRRLRLAREKRRLSVTEVGDALHLECGVVQALEDDDYEALPPATFTKGYLRSYARFLELDEDAILKSFRQVANREAERPLTAQVGRESRSNAGGGAGGWIVLVLVVVLAGGGWLVWSRGGDLPQWADAMLRGGEQMLDNGSSLVGAEETPGSGDVSDTAGASAQTSSAGEARSPDAGSPSTGTMDTLVEAAEPASPEAGTSEGDEGSGTNPVGAGDTVSGSDADPAAATGGSAADGTAGTTPAQSADAAVTSTGVADGGSGVPGAADEDFGGPLSEEAPEPGLQADEPASPSTGTDAARTASTDATGDDASGSTENAAEDEDALASATAPSADDGPAGSGEDDVALEETATGADTGAATTGDEAPAADQGTLVFTFTGESWMEVRDARGRRLLFGLVGQAGERRVSGVPPFDIVVGDVGRVSVAYEGDPVDLSEYTRGSVARLTLGSAQ